MKMIEQNKDVLNWLDRKLDEAKAVIEQFKKGNFSISFEMIERLSTEWQEIEKGVSVRILEKTKSNIKLQCKMEKGAFLLIHAHPNYNETFKVKTGILLDKESNSILDKDTIKTFYINEYHTMLAVTDCDMEIFCVLQ